MVIMISRNNLKNSEIILHDISSIDKSYSLLKNFLHFLNIEKYPKPYRFCFVPQNPLLIPTLTLRDNIQLETVYHQYIHDKDQLIENSITRYSNPHLQQLVNLLGPMNKKPSEVNIQQCKLCVLIKALIQETDFVYLDSPETHLNDTLQEIFIKALKRKTEYSNQLIFIHSHTDNTWEVAATKKLYQHGKKTFKLLNLNKPNLLKAS